MQDALAHLSRDPALAGLIARMGPPTLAPDRRSPYVALVRAIAHQQVHGAAAKANLGRFLALYPGHEFPAPELVLATDDATLRACGFSLRKIESIRDICTKTLDGTVPNRDDAESLSDEELIARLTKVRGVGRWTVEMLLIFTLGRPDVLPVDDYGVRDGYRLLHGLRAQPQPKELAVIGEAWAPFRSTAAWYLWRASDEGKRIKVLTSRA